MPAVTTTDPVAHRTVLRRVEFAFEGLRWGVIAFENQKQFTGMKFTNNPSTYTAFPVDAEGYYFYQKRNFIVGKNELWPIQQSEHDLNKNLTQNPDYIGLWAELLQSLVLASVAKQKQAIWQVFFKSISH